MNELIKELAEQAGAIPIHGEPKNRAIVGYDNINKFAELIVRECASMAKAFHNHGYDFTGDLELDEFMLKHFGVEE